MVRRKNGTVNLAVDYDKIQGLLEDRSLNWSQASMVLGYGASVLSDRRNRGILWPESDVNRLAIILNVDPKEITIQEKRAEIKTDKDKLDILIERMDYLTQAVDKLMKMANESSVASTKDELLKEEMDFVSVLFSTTAKIYELKIMKEARIRGFDEDKVKMAMKHMGYTQTAINGMGNTHQVLWSRPVI